ncbi:ABC transporter permease [Actinotalea sp.]|uniref:ABC transporter permease n=1 Tax=Actinotalea sp. TaxID=1872145 RepID=UPI002C3BC4F1|nr:ABC transporter permease [Actinotalea sp.]HQY32915.1 ABC transporter permease [Actinotalea sp.]HRA51380.1 ABC transporter permease [Actinotalea sp.]
MSTPTAPSSRLVSPVTLALVHFRYGFLETVRVPIAVIGTTVFPTLALLSFVVPQEAAAGDPVFATAATAQLAVFAVMSTCIFTYGIGVAEDRALPFDPYVRTLPAGPEPRMAGRVLNGTLFALLGVLPLVAVAALLTEASIPAARLLAGLGALVLASVPFLLIGLTIGYGLPAKAAVAVAQVTVFPLAFAGGLFVPPETFPGWLDTLSTTLPSRAARDVVVPVAVGGDVSGRALVVLVAWSVVFAAITAAVYRRDEGRRFR